MNEYFQTFCLAMLQGLTEILPISSSGHLVLLPQLVGWHDQGLAFDVAVHAGTLFAVLVYFRTDIGQLLIAWANTLRGHPPTLQSKLMWAILIATIPVGLAGVLLEDWVKQALRMPIPVALATLIFGMLLGLADWRGTKRRDISQLNRKDVLFIGCAQLLALIPGTSRSGITLTAGLILGLSREAAVRFSFLLAIPVITLASIWQLRALLSSATAVRWDLIIFAMIVSAIVAFFCIRWFLIFIQRHGVWLFVLYRVILGVILLLLFI